MWFAGIVCYIWILLLNSGYAYFSYSTRFEDEVSQHQLVRGFFVGTSPNSSFAARINDNYDYPASAHTIEFPRGFLDDAVHPVFTLLPNVTHNERALWSNGAQYIFYLTPEESHSAPYGTWLVGSTIGVDSGMAFLKPKHATAVAVSSSDSWNYHDGASWKPFPLPIKNSHVVSLSVASVSMLHSMQRTEMTSSYVLWKLPDLGIASHLSTLLRSLGITSSPPSASDHYPVYWDAASSTWTSFVVSHAVPYAYPLLALASHSQSEEDVAIYHLIADEFYSSYWRLFLRSSDAGDEVTYTLHFSPDGVFDPDEKKSIKLVSLSSYDQAIYNEYTTQRLDSVAAGDYIWLWQRTSNSIESLFLRAAYVNDSAIVFHIYPTHRTELLQRSQLQHATELLVARAEYDGYGFYRDSEAVDVISLFHIPLVTSWLYQHLTVHEGFVADDISSCFLYHAAVVMPEQLVYAAEMMCLLMGAKSVSMVQYTTSSNHQTNFPLVSALSNYIFSHIAAQSLLGQKLRYIIHNYKSDQTVVFYRSEASALVEALRPHREAQALHIAPYPEVDHTAADHKRILEEQVYNSYWNGYVLGYNERFIVSYCENYNAQITPNEKFNLIQRAKKDVEKYFETNSLVYEVVRLGNYDDLISDEVLDDIEMFLL